MPEPLTDCPETDQYSNTGEVPSNTYWETRTREDNRVQRLAS
jgi:hypothetical protein